MSKITLNAMERANLVSLIPKEGTVVNLRLIKGLIEKIGFSADEVEIIQRESKEGGTIDFRTLSQIESKTVDIKPAEKTILADELKKLSDSGKLSLAMLDLYDKFVVTNEKADNS